MVGACTSEENRAVRQKNDVVLDRSENTAALEQIQAKPLEENPIQNLDSERGGHEE